MEFCGYNIPYPTEPELLFRIQTRAGVPALPLFKRGLIELGALFRLMGDKFQVGFWVLASSPCPWTKPLSGTLC